MKGCFLFPGPGEALGFKGSGALECGLLGLRDLLDIKLLLGSPVVPFCPFLFGGLLIRAEC